MDKKVKKKVLQQIPYGAYVVGTRMKDGKNHLMFGTWLMQTSFKPTLVAFAFKKDSRTLANVRRSKTFTISLLGVGDGQLAEQVLDEAFDKVRIDRTPSGLPIILDSAGWIECELMGMLEKGDHYIVLAEVVDAGPGKGERLLLDALGWHYGG
ncbi:MAG TPA: flavin reductase family protein [Thermoplasmata archaeon]|nr:flavin reductase family protein [Thermoplasmata archaeon]